MCWTESMVGGTIFHRDVIQREISRALVLNLSGKTRCSGTAEEIFVLDNAFALIEGHAELQGSPSPSPVPRSGTGPKKGIQRHCRSWRSHVLLPEQKAATGVSGIF